MAPGPCGSGPGRGPVEEEVALAPLAVVPDVECRERSEAADRTIGVVVVGHVDPQRGPAVAGVAVVEVEGLRVVGEGRDDAAGHALLLHVPGVVVEGLLPGAGRPGGPRSSAARTGRGRRGSADR